MATLTTSPWFVQQLLTDTGVIAAGYKLFTYAAGTTTKLATYTDVGGLVAHANPIILDAAGRVPSGLFLLPASYKFVLAPPGDTDPPSAPIWTRDNQGATPGTTVEQDFAITAGEALTANDAIYISDGSGGLIAGRAYKADADNTYSSMTPIVGFVVADVASGAAGTARGSGRMTGFVGLTTGARYYLSATAGAITATAPANSRDIGQADSVSSLLIAANPAPMSASTVTALIDPRIKTLCNGRLSLTTAVPVTSGDVTGATAIKWVPYQGNEVALYSGSAWVAFALAELSIAVPATTDTNYDVFIDYHATTPALTLQAWNSATARHASGTYATLLPVQDGVYVKSTNGTAVDATERYVGTFRTTGVSGQTEDSAAKRYLWNYYHQKRRVLRRLESTDTWSYSTGSYRQANGSSANQVDVVVGVAEVILSLGLQYIVQSNGAHTVGASIGEDSTTTPLSGVTGMGLLTTGNARDRGQASLVHMPAVGRHFYAWLELGNVAGTQTWSGDGGAPTELQAGLTGFIEG